MVSQSEPQHIEIKFTPDQLRSMADMGIAIIVIRSDAIRWEHDSE